MCLQYFLIQYNIGNYETIKSNYTLWCLYYISWTKNPGYKPKETIKQRK